MGIPIVRRLSNALSHGWNVFKNGSQLTSESRGGYYGGVSTRPDKIYNPYGSKDSLTSSIYNRIATDVSTLDFKHVRLTDDGTFKDVIQSSLNDILTLEANIDQTGRTFIQDAVHSLCDEGAIALVPIETDINPANKTGGYDITTIRVGRITDWSIPGKVTVNIYDEDTGLFREATLPKRMVAIIENPFYAVMNEPNSILKRLNEKIDLLDIYDQKNITGKLDIIIQLPYTVKSTKRKAEAEERRQLIEEQMSGSKYGVAYIDATEKVTQLNRPADNQLQAQVAQLFDWLYNQLGMTRGIFDGTASESEILNYYNRTIEVFANAIVDEIKRKFLTKTARRQKQSVMYFRDPFKLTPIEELAELADKLTRNAILSSNEFRGLLGFKPRPEKDADALRNKNLNIKDQIPESTLARKVKKSQKLADQNGRGKSEGSTKLNER